MEHQEYLVNELAKLCGIVPDYWDIFGKKHTATQEMKRATLRAMRIDVDSTEALEREIRMRGTRPWTTVLEPVMVFSAEKQPVEVPLHLPVPEGAEDGLSITWSLKDEQCRVSKHSLTEKAITTAGTNWIDGTRYIRIMLKDEADREPGYYDLYVECNHRDGIFAGGSKSLSITSRVAIAPDACYLPEKLKSGKAWGLAVNLYAVRSERNWGIGDFTDLARIVEWVHGLGGGFVGINPLHAIPNTYPYGISPYSPISRMYKNFIYLDMEAVPDVAESEAAGDILRSEAFQKDLGEVRSADLIDYPRIAKMKERILAPAFVSFLKKHHGKGTSRDEAFRKYCEEEGRALDAFALYSALWKHLHETRGTHGWPQWPQEYKDHEGEAVRAFGKDHNRERLYHAYVQWLIHEQLGGASALSVKLGMPLGLYHDLAIGAIGGGSDAWIYQSVMGLADVGAPPDDFSPAGQNWGFPPMTPEQLKETGYEPVIRTMRESMKYGGALRIDHALGLFRLYWIPRGKEPREGVYVEYPHEDLLRIIALESVRNKVVVIGEDLGTIGDNVREALKQFNMLSYRLFYFERNYPDPSFRMPEKYPEPALCAVTTHDLPTLTGYWQGRDIAVRKEQGMYPDDESWKGQLQERERDKKLLLELLRSQGLLPAGSPEGPGEMPGMTSDLMIAIYRFLDSTPSRLMLVSLDDVIGTLDQQNLPGTVDSHPNWQQRTPLTLEAMVRDRRFLDLAARLTRSTRL
ncbi:MAG: 4-alpha-glucanotransferase [Nitrospirae bacterium GWC2_57_13]|jgi:4-alpha-glucanotransferase|nr:MAG: 4-alpha-glucanotransferase [Nitrospirae bacterium GWC2_57_13]HAS53352.1 4-alpha-glucanotransferase [Nitrospiraceae bacterium]